MAYKYAKGKVYRGDIYDQDDTQRDTYIDFGGETTDNYIGLVTSGSTALAVKGSSVGIGTATPTEKLEVYPDTDISAVIGRAHIGYNGAHTDAATFSHVDLDASTTYALYQGSNGLTILNAASGQGLYFRIANSDVMRIDSDGKLGVGTTSPTSTFHVSGSQAGNYTQTTGNITFNETHYVVDYTGDGDATFTLPDVSGITGRMYYIISHAQGALDRLVVTGSGGAFQGVHLEGDSDKVAIDGDTPQSLSIISTGTNWFILHDGRSQE